MTKTDAGAAPETRGSMMRLLAPPHISAAFLSSGPVSVIDGAIEVAGDLSQGDRAGLAASGFTPVPAKRKDA
jgi:hypothetical protein